MTAPVDSSSTVAQNFAEAVIDWFEIHGRHDLPWQVDPSPYRVWISEIMLQQTRVGTVIPYFRRFMTRFPDVSVLAAADIDQVLHLWTGLGYYARARNLHKAARTIVEEHGGGFPDTVEELTRLSGIGPSTAGAILALAHGRRAPILDGNVKRVLARCYAVEGFPGNSKTRSELWTLAEELTPSKRVAAYTQGMMDLGATLCTRSNPDCPQCPLYDRCLARQRGEIDRFPGKRPAKTLPVRSVTMFILQDREGRVLLEKRPPNGIWGSLYSLPQIENSDMPSPNNETKDGKSNGNDGTNNGNNGTPTNTAEIVAVAQASSGNDWISTNSNGNDEIPTNTAEIAGAAHASPASATMGHPHQGNHGTPINTAEIKGRTNASPALNSLPANLATLCLAIEPPIELPPIRHGFTHFQLDITPVHYKVTQLPSAVAESDRWLWYSIVEPVEVGLAAPVRKLLAALAASE